MTFFLQLTEESLLSNPDQCSLSVTERSEQRSFPECVGRLHERLRGGCYPRVSDQHFQGSRKWGRSKDSCTPMTISKRQFAHDSPEASMRNWCSFLYALRMYVIKHVVIRGIIFKILIQLRIITIIVEHLCCKFCSFFSGNLLFKPRAKYCCFQIFAVE